MSNGVANNLSRENIRKLLAAIGSGPAEDTQIEVSEYDWHQPHYFSSSQLNRLDNFTEKIAAAIAETFSQLYHNDFNVTITSNTQHFASELFEQVLNSGQNDYYLAFGTDQEHLCGLIDVPQQTAVTWTKQLLGDDESEKDTGDTTSQPDPDVHRGSSRSASGLSQLEESLLFDIVSAIVSQCTPMSIGDLQPVSELVKGQLPIKLSTTPDFKSGLQPVQEISKIVFSIEKASSADDKPAAACEAYLLIPCSRLAPAVGKIIEADKNPNVHRDDDISKAILEHLQQMPVSVTAQLAVAVLTFEQIISLSPYDILLLDKAINEPIELVVEGRTVLRGQPTKSAGQHAIVFTEVPMYSGTKAKSQALNDLT